MPIYEFYCQACHMIFNFFSSSVNTSKKPLCPRCRKTRLERRPSVFASLRKRGEDEEDTPLPDLDEAKMEQAMSVLAREAENVDENDPRQAADLMRKLTAMTGLDLGSGMQEALQRMEDGEDPEKIEEEMGAILEEEEPFNLKKKAAAFRRYLPPKVDEKLYDL